MEQIFINFSKSDLQDMIAQTVNACLSHNKQPTPQDADKWFDLPGFCKYHPEKPAKQTVYQWLSDSNSDLPRHKKGKKVYFRKSEVDQWLASGKQYTRRDAANDANSFLSANA